VFEKLVERRKNSMTRLCANILSGVHITVLTLKWRKAGAQSGSYHKRKISMVLIMTYGWYKLMALWLRA